MTKTPRIEGFVINRADQPGDTPGLLELALVVAGDLDQRKFIISRELSAELIGELAKKAIKPGRRK